MNDNMIEWPKASRKKRRGSLTISLQRRHGCFLHYRSERRPSWLVLWSPIQTIPKRLERCVYVSLQRTLCSVNNLLTKSLHHQVQITIKTPGNEFGENDEEKEYKRKSEIFFALFLLVFLIPHRDIMKITIKTLKQEQLTVEAEPSCKVWDQGRRKQN